jgi:tripartite-type tricarboxylate transporter receptor subunit TctC
MSRYRPPIPLAVGAACLALALAPTLAVGAEDFPVKSITLVIPFGAGGSHDLTARALSSVAPQYLGPPLIVQLRPGGGGAIASDQVAKAKADGYTLLFGAPGPNSTLPAVEGRSVGPDGLTAVAKINDSPGVLITRSDRPYKTMKELVEWARANPGKLTHGTTGPWGAADVPMKQLMKDTGISAQLVPHDGGGPALLAVLGGHVDTSFLLTAQSLPHIRSGKLRPLAVIGTRRLADLPEVPTGREQGFNVVYVIWRAVLAPKDTPRPIVEKLAAAFKQMTEDKSFRALVKQLGDEPGYLGPDEFMKEWRAELEAHRELGVLYKK